MPGLKIEGGSVEAVELEIKRCYLPGVRLSSLCPHCGEEITKDLGDEYLSYPKVGEVIKMPFYHEYNNEDEWADHEWFESIVLDLTVRPAFKEEIEGED